MSPDMSPDAALDESTTTPPRAALPPFQPPLADLGPAFFSDIALHPLPQPHWVGISQAAAQWAGLPEGWADAPEALEVFTGNRAHAGSVPRASVYSGHQFGVWAGQLGDGRACLLGEWLRPTDEQRIEVQLKGSGPTPYSRMGDGRAVLRSSIREFLCSEAMHALGIPTTRALCVTGSPAPVRREEIETAAVVTRLSPSFLRFGHLEHFSANGQTDELRKLADHVIDRFYPEARSPQAGVDEADKAHPPPTNAYAALLRLVSLRTADLLAQWQAVGFCHGVMNTDNMSLLGLTIDYGPFQFMDGFDPAHICNHSDHQGRYAFARQPQIAYWNLYALGQALLPLIDSQEAAVAALSVYEQAFPKALQARMRAKLGLTKAADGDRALMDDAMRLLAAHRIDHTLFWRRLASAVEGDTEPVRDLMPDRAAFDAWFERHLAALAGQDLLATAAQMRRVNPKYVLRNHLGEQAIAAARQGDMSEVARLLQVLQHPFDEQPEHEALADLPPAWAADIAISCSS